MLSITSDYPDFRQSKHIYVGESRIATKLNIEGDGSVGYEEVNTYYYHTDHLGSAQLITDYEGGIYEHIEYTPYGELWIEEKTESFDKIPFRFTGKELDEETWFVYFGMRYLSPKTNRWLGVDPALEQYLPVPGNDQQSRSRNSKLPNAGIFNHFNLSPYVYCNNNPIIFYDPDGNMPFLVVTGLIGAAIGAVAGGVISYMETGEVDWVAVGTGALIGGAAGLTLGAGTALITTGSALASTGSVLAALGLVGGGAATTGAAGSWAAYNAANPANNAYWIGQKFANWFCKFHNIANSAREIVVKGIGRLDAIIQNANAIFHKGTIIELKNYNWANYSSYKGIINKFTDQALRYLNLIGQVVNGEKVNSLIFYFSSKPPQAIIDALENINVIVDWVK